MKIEDVITFDPEFIEYMTDILITVMPDMSLKHDSAWWKKTVERAVLGILTKDEFSLRNIDHDVVAILRIAIDHYKPEEVKRKS